MVSLGRASRFCEAVREAGIAQPVNSSSSLIFFGLVAWGLVLWTQRTKQFIHNSPKYSYIFMAVVALIGVSSAIGHSGLTSWGGTADFSSMYLLVTLTLLLGISWFKQIKSTTLISIWALINVPLVYIATQSARITDYTFMTFVIAVIIVELLALGRLKQLGNRYFWLSILSLSVGYGIWQLDVRGIWCDPTSIWQGHAVWHLLTAIAAGFLYLYLATKQPASSLHEIRLV